MCKTCAGVAVSCVILVAVAGCECGGPSYYTGGGGCGYTAADPQTEYSRALAGYNSACQNLSAARTASNLCSVVPPMNKTGLVISLLGGAASQINQSDAERQMEMARLRLVQAQAQLNQAGHP